MKFKQKQDWSNGNTVRVGFLSLIVIDKVATPGDYKPDMYVLRSSAGKLYTFVPHNGLTACEGMTVEECKASW